MSLSRTNVAAVTQLVEEGKLSRQEAAKVLKTSVRTIHNYIKKYKEYGAAGLVDHRGGHYAKLTPITVQEIIRCKQERPQRSARWIRDRLKLNVSVETVRQTLVRHNLNSMRMGPGLSAAEKKKFVLPQ